MAFDYDIVIRNGTVADGLGSPLVTADVAVKDGIIQQVGKVSGSGKEEVDAQGLLVTPGFVDIHTHYDGQATWDDRLLPSSWHGVTTVVMGSCGVGFAPVRDDGHETLIELMEGIEDIPGTALHEGLQWDWESFPDYLDALAGRTFDVDVCAQLPHGPLRLYVMGERASRLEDATPSDIQQLRRLSKEAAEAGALGFSTSRSLNHKSVTGDPTPTLRAREDELMGIALGLKDAGRGVLQWVSDFDPDERAAEYEMIKRIVRTSGCPMSISVGQNYRDPEAWRETLTMIEEARREGLPLLAQVAPRPIGVILGLTASSHPFRKLPSFRPLLDQPLPEQVAAMRRPEIRTALIAEAMERPSHYGLSRLFPMSGAFAYGEDANASVAVIAERSGRDANDVLYDLLLEDNGENLIFYGAVGYWHHNFDAIREMISSPASVVGIGDGGAHVGMVCDASFPTSMLLFWGRDSELGVVEAVRRQTSATAAAVGLNDRGALAPGMRADLNIIDMDALSLERPQLSYDLPSGAKRLLQRANGYVATIVAGVVTYRNGEATGAMPGRLVRGPQPGPGNNRASTR